MCGRFTFAEIESVVQRFELDRQQLELRPRYNIAPSQLVPVVIRENRSNRLYMFRWGMIPRWAKDESIGSKLINARAETLENTPSFRGSINQRRCLVLADGFYEWKKEGRTKRPYRFKLLNNKPFAFAGLWDSWLSPSGQLINSCTIITTISNKLMKPIHNRMPVILSPEMESVWLSGNVAFNNEIKNLLRPFPAEQMTVCEVSSLVNSPAYNGPECLLPIYQIQPVQLKLF